MEKSRNELKEVLRKDGINTALIARMTDTEIMEACSEESLRAKEEEQANIEDIANVCEVTLSDIAEVVRCKNCVHYEKKTLQTREQEFCYMGIDKYAEREDNE